MNAQAIETMVRDVLERMNNPDALRPASPASSAPQAVKAGVADYPLTNKHPDWVKTATGKTLDDLTLANVLNGSVTAQDVRITPEILRIQADIARAAGRSLLAMNFERAAELTAVPDERVLEIYNALRPFRSSQEELLAIAGELESRYQATICAGFVREAAGYYLQRKKLKGDD
ncbi:propanediol dehydratase small subunit PduE [Acerihabitans sp.]|uniref:propanediol dehydratase small subunit PduE n=1 Tax=Acerihabitans sp. TaxID=2811394 RepID=UPI002EDAD857